MQRQEMLDTALDLFSQKGYHNVTMHEIANKAEFAVGTLYKFFKNKEDLYSALILEKTEGFYQTIVGALEEGDDEIDKLRKYIQARGAVFRANVPMIRLYFSEAYGESHNLFAELNMKIRQRRDETLTMIASVFASGMRKNLFKRTAEPAFLAVALEGITTAFLFKWLEEPESHPFPEDPDTILNILFKGLAE